MNPAHELVLLPHLDMGNMASVANIIKKCGGTSSIISNPEELKKARKIILAGVGSFDTAMQVIQKQGWQEVLFDRLNQGAIILGICLGMQIMGKSSEEGKLPGLGWVNAHIKRFNFAKDSQLKIPHMGWNTVKSVRENLLIDHTIEQRFYFVHSYHMVCNQPDDVLATTYHGGVVTAAFARENIYGVQFHPEKSHRFGMALIKKFLELPC